jgi:chromosome segregation ATPase
MTAYRLFAPNRRADDWSSRTEFARQVYAEGEQLGAEVDSLEAEVAAIVSEYKALETRADAVRQRMSSLESRADSHDGNFDVVEDYFAEGDAPAEYVEIYNNTQGGIGEAVGELDNMLVDTPF